MLVVLAVCSPSSLKKDQAHPPFSFNILPCVLSTTKLLSKKRNRMDDIRIALELACNGGSWRNIIQKRLMSFTFQNFPY